MILRELLQVERMKLLLFQLHLHFVATELKMQYHWIPRAVKACK